jgi:predicted transport protein
MPLFNDTSGKLKLIKEVKFALEKDLQKLTEDNLETVFGLKFISSEFSLQNFRIDTLAFDEENNSFVVIEYKRDRSFSVIDQGYSYLALMLNNKADFILEYNERMKDNLKRDDVDWSQSRVIFVSNSFTTYQQNAINFKDLPIELWEASKYDNGSVLYSQLKSPDSNESIKTVSKNKTIENVSKEVKKYSLSDHFKPGWDKGRELYEQLKERVFALDDRINEAVVRPYIGFKINNLLVCYVTARKNGLRVWLTRTKPNEVKDPEKKLKYVDYSWKNYNQHISCFDVADDEGVDYAMTLIKQAHKKHFS